MSVGDQHEILGVSEADEQHRELFARFDEFIAALNNHVSKKELLKMVEYLDGYVKRHFETEEKLMRKHAYGDAAAHSEEHRKFMIDLWFLKTKLKEEGVSDEMLSMTLRLLVQWLSQHISKTDEALGGYLKSRGVGKNGTAG